MQRIVLVLGVVLLGLANVAPQRVSRADFEVPVDHFRPQDPRVERFSYEYNDAYFNGTGPLFVYINDLNDYTNRWLQRGLVHDLAQELGGALVTAQFRYFGLNTPTENVTWDNLSHLTVEQILADVATLIPVVKADLNATNTTQVFVWGPGWGGTFAVLARQKYPNLISGAWSTGGIFEPTVTTTEVYSNLGNIITERGGRRCGQRLTEAFSRITLELASRNSSTLINEFSLCRPWNMNNVMDRSFFAEGILYYIQAFINQHHSSGVQNICNALDAVVSDPFRSLTRWFRFAYEADFGRCFNFDSIGRHRWLADTLLHNPGTASGRRQLLYLQCTQLGHFTTTDTDPSSVFGNIVPETYRRQLCEAAFGSEFNFNQLRTNVQNFRNSFGGRQPRVDHVIFTNGELDATSTLGITEYAGRQSLVINIPAYGKAADLQAASDRDSTVLFGAKYLIKNTIRRWVVNGTVV